jgi:sec-independent protein translocase protein TatA
MPVAMFNLGAAEMVVIGIVALLLFGPRLPMVMRSLGKGIVEFKKGLRDTEDEIHKEIENSDADSKQIDHKPQA